MQLDQAPDMQWYFELLSVSYSPSDSIKSEHKPNTDSSPQAVGVYLRPKLIFASSSPVIQGRNSEVGSFPLSQQLTWRVRDSKCLSFHLSRS